MAAHSHWRINVTQNDGDVNFLAIAEVEMRASIGGADQCSGGTPSASTSDGTAPASSAFDNDSATRWSTTSGTLTGWLRYSFASPVDVVEITIQAHPATPARSPRVFSLQHSDDGSTWTDFASYTSTGWTAGQIRTFVGVNASSASTPAITGSGTGGVLGSAETLSEISGNGSASQEPFDSSAQSLLSIIGSGGATSGPVGNSRNANGSPLILPAITGLGAGGQTQALPAIVASGTGFAGVVARSTQELEITSSATASPGITGSSAAALEAIAGNGTTPPQSAQTLPALAGSGTALVGVAGRSTATLDALAGEATGSVPVVGDSSATLFALRGEGVALTGSIGASSATLAAFVLAAEGTSGTLGTSSVAVPIITGEGSGYGEVVGTSVLTLPAIFSAGSAGVAAGTAYTVYAYNTESRALTTYSNMPIRGLARFNGVYLAAGPGGLFTLGGDTDDTALINATARLAQTDFGDPQLKRVASMYVHYRTTGDLNLKVVTDEDETYDYTLEAAGHQTLSPGRVKLGRGLKGAYWTLEIANRDGADFELDRVLIEPVSTSRRIG